MKNNHVIVPLIRQLPDPTARSRYRTANQRPNPALSPLPSALVGAPPFLGTALCHFAPIKASTAAKHTPLAPKQASFLGQTLASEGPPRTFPVLIGPRSTPVRVRVGFGEIPAEKRSVLVITGGRFE